MALFKINENPDDWGRCRADGKVIRWANAKELEKHVNHKVEALDGFHTLELVRYFLGWL